MVAPLFYDEERNPVIPAFAGMTLSGECCEVRNNGSSKKEGRAKRWTATTVATATNVAEAMRRLSLKKGRAKRWTAVTTATVANATEAMRRLSLNKEVNS